MMATVEADGQPCWAVLRRQSLGESIRHEGESSHGFANDVNGSQSAARQGDGVLLGAREEIPAVTTVTADSEAAASARGMISC